MPADRVTINARGAERLRAGHPWVFRQDVTSGPATDALAGGPALVQVVDARGRALAWATWSTTSPLALRAMAGATDDAPGSFVDLVRHRLEAAWTRRTAMPRDADAFRWAHGEGDGVPGLFIDVFAHALVLQAVSAAMDAHLPAIAAWAHERAGARVVIARNDGSAREFEGLERRAEMLVGDRSDARLVYRLGENDFEADLFADAKTGGFLDQADNHRALAALAPPGARVLDAFTHHGGFALPLARRGGPVLAVDANPEAVARAQANARRNGLGNVTVREADAFELLRGLEARAERFDVVVLDPPALAKRAGGVDAAERRYRELIVRGLRLAAPRGLVAACSCSGKVTREIWERIVVGAAATAGLPVQVVEGRAAAVDHPELLGVPETGHLKCWILRVAGR